MGPEAIDYIGDAHNAATLLFFRGPDDKPSFDIVIGDAVGG